MWDLETLVETYAEAVALVKSGSEQDQATVTLCLKEFKERRLKPTTFYKGRNLYPYYARQYGLINDNGPEFNLQ